MWSCRILFGSRIRPAILWTDLYWRGPQRWDLSSPSDGSSFLLEVSWSESASVAALARHQDTMFLIVPSKKMLGNMKQAGWAPAPGGAATLLSHWHKCNTMKPFIYQWKRSQWRMTNAFSIQSRPPQQFIHQDSLRHVTSALEKRNVIILFRY